MNLKDLIEVVPELLLLVVPGYISVNIKQKYNSEKQLEHFDITLYSILFSFIIGILYSIIAWISSKLCNNVAPFFEIDEVKQFSYILLAVILGYILVKVPPSGVGEKILGIFNKNLSSEPSVWIKAMKNEKGSWATVYLKNGIIYTGMLEFYTSDINDENKEILLSSYRRSVRNEKAYKKPNEFCLVIDDHTNDQDAKVFLTQDAISAIELHK